MKDRNGFILDLNRCTGCRACELACSTENNLGFGRSWRRIETFNIDLDPRASHHHLSIGCNHCGNAPCIAACPARAITRDDRNELVTLNPDHCLGCGYCAWVCPFEAPTLNASTGTMGKCTLCPDRTAEGDRPACVEACPTDALRVADIGDLDLSNTAPGFPNTNAEPAMRFKPLRAGTEAPESTWTVDQKVLEAFDAVRRPRAAGGDLRNQWPLVVFTLSAAALVALQTAVVFGTVSPHPVQAMMAVAAAGISMIHLGRPGRAWRAAAGVARSWLSREILLYGAFVCLLALQAASPDLGGVAQIAALVGWFALFAIDRVYDTVRRPRSMPVHSADILGTAALMTAIFLGHLPVALVIASIRMLLFVLRQNFSWRDSRRSWARTVIRLVPPAAGLALMGLGGDRWVAVVLVGAGEVMDRLFFYLELQPTTFAETVDADLISLVSESV